MTAARSQTPVESVLTHAVVSAASSLGLDYAIAAKSLGLQESEFAQMAAGQCFLQQGTPPFDNAALLIRLYEALATQIGNNEEHSRRWMQTYNHSLKATPEDAIGKEGGVSHVLAYLVGAGSKF